MSFSGKVLFGFLNSYVALYKLDRLGRSLKYLLKFVAILNEKQIGLQSISNAIDTTTPQGRLFFNISACFQNLKEI